MYSGGTPERSREGRKADGEEAADGATAVVVFREVSSMSIPTNGAARRYVNSAGKLKFSQEFPSPGGGFAKGTFEMDRTAELSTSCDGYYPAQCAGRSYPDSSTMWTAACCADAGPDVASKAMLLAELALPLIAQQAHDDVRSHAEQPELPAPLGPHQTHRAHRCRCPTLPLLLLLLLLRLPPLPEEEAWRKACTARFGSERCVNEDARPREAQRNNLQHYNCLCAKAHTEFLGCG